MHTYFLKAALLGDGNLEEFWESSDWESEECGDNVKRVFQLRNLKMFT